MNGRYVYAKQVECSIDKHTAYVCTVTIYGAAKVVEIVRQIDALYQFVCKNGCCLRLQKILTEKKVVVISHLFLFVSIKEALLCTLRHSHHILM